MLDGEIRQAKETSRLTLYSSGERKYAVYCAGLWRFIIRFLMNATSRHDGGRTRGPVEAQPPAQIVDSRVCITDL